MATANILEEPLKCSICLDVYTDPHVLVCLHTFCKPCIDQLETSNCVTCPDCREVSLMKNVRKDFRTHALMATQRGEEGNRKMVNGDYKCGMCDDDNAQFHCKECSYLMCQPCKKNHDNMTVCIDHLVTSITDIMKEAEHTLKGPTQTWNEQGEKAAAKIADVDHSLKELSGMEENKIAMVKSQVDKVIQGLQNMQQDYIQLIKDSSTETKSNLMNRKEYATNLSKEIATKLQFIESIIATKDFKTMLEIQSVQKYLQTEASRLDTIKCEFSAPVEVMIKQEVIIATGIEVISEASQANFGSATTRQAHVNLTPLNSYAATSSAGSRAENHKVVGYKKLGQNRYQKYKINQTGCDYNMRCMCMIDNELWCAKTKLGILVYSTELEFIRNIKTPGDAWAVTQANNQDIIVACCNNTGLHVTDKHGTMKAHITTGSFSDVTSYDDKIYALEWKKKLVMIFSSGNEKWIPSNNINIDNIGIFSRLSMSDNTLFVSRWWEHCIAAIHIDNHDNSQSSEERRYGCYGAQPGQLIAPQICNVDSQGIVLVADCGNHRLQLLDTRSGEWSVVPLLPDRVYWPRCAIVAYDGDTLWLSDNHGLTKYNKI